MRFNQQCAAVFVLFCFTQAVAAGPFAPAAGQSGTTAVSQSDSRLVQWAQGYSEYLPGPLVDNQFQTPELALGPAVGNSFDIVSLGDKGRITLSFAGSIFNGPGWDFAVFENGFSDSFLELAFVEVSSDGTTFVRFPAFSLTPSPANGFASVDPTNIEGLAGKYKQGFGTPFDLDLFASANIPNFDANDITHVRLVDIKGDGSELDNWPSAPGFDGPNPIYDPFPTTGSVGFDLDAVGVRYFSPAALHTPLPPALLLFGLPVLLALRRRSTVLRHSHVSISKDSP